MLRKTRSAARELGVTYAKLWGVLRSGKMPPPAKDESGDYVWADSDLKRAREALAIDLRRKQTVTK